MHAQVWHADDEEEAPAPATSPLKASPIKSSKPHHSLGYALLPTLPGLFVCGALGAMIAN